MSCRFVVLERDQSSVAVTDVNADISISYNFHPLIPSVLSPHQECGAERVNMPGAYGILTHMASRLFSWSLAGGGVPGMIKMASLHQQ